MFYAIGNAFDAKSGFWETGGAGHIFTHAVTGGIIADLQGGKFAHGFWSAGVTKAAGSGINGMCSNCGAAGVALRVVVAASLGGTVSKLSGGKFSNGARTAAFAQLFNNELNKPKVLKLTTAEAEQIESAIHDLIVEMESQVGDVLFSNDVEQLSDLLGTKLYGNAFADDVIVDEMVLNLIKIRQLQGITKIHASFEQYTAQGANVLVNVLSPAKFGWVERVFSAVSSLFTGPTSQISNISFYGQNRHWYSSFDKSGTTYTKKYKLR